MVAALGADPSEASFATGRWVHAGAETQQGSAQGKWRERGRGELKVNVAPSRQGVG